MSGLTNVAFGLLGSEGTLTPVLELVAEAFEIIGVAILAVGGLAQAFRAVRGAVAGRPVYSQLRRGLGRVLLLGLEVLVAADVVRTVAVETTVESVAILGLLVIVRTVLSFALAAEVDGVVPWRRAEVRSQLRGAGADAVD